MTVAFRTITQGGNKGTAFSALFVTFISEFENTQNHFNVVPLWFILSGL